MALPRTYNVRAGEITRSWHVIDATGRPLGRLASHVARLLQGKHKSTYTPHLDVGDYVVVVNASHVAITGKHKAGQKMYYRHSGYPGGLKAVSLERTLAQRPGRVIEHAVRGMVPKSALGRAMMRKLRVYAGPSHPHLGQVGQEGQQQ